MGLYSKCELVRTVKGRGNHCDYGRGEFVVLNDDTYEVWKRRGEKMNKFKKWYKATSYASEKNSKADIHVMNL